MKADSFRPVLDLLAGPVPGADMCDAELLDRFRSSGEEAAFTLLVERHASAVLAVCRRVLGDTPDADDAFQATFVVLLRKAGSVRKCASLGSWLYGVACRVAGRARARRGRTVGLPDLPHEDEGPAEVAARREMTALLYEEVGRLPERYRAPLVLCSLEGKTCEEAARELRWPRSSVAYRLRRGHELLRRRMQQRGVAGPELVSMAAPGAPARLVLATVRLGRAVGEHTILAPSPALALADGVTRGVPLWRASVAAVVVVALATSVLGAALFRGEPNGPAQATDPPSALPSTVPLPLDGPARRDPTVPPGAVARVGSAGMRHGTWLRHLAWSPDGKVIASRGSGVLRLWDTGGRLLHHLAVADNELFCQTIFTDGGRTVLVHDGKACRWFDVEPGKEKRSLDAMLPDGRVCVSPRGNALVSVRGKDVVLVDLPSLRERYRWSTEKSWYWELAFAPDGDKLVAVEWDQAPVPHTKALRIFDTRTGRACGQVPLPNEGFGSPMFTPDGKGILAHSFGGSVLLWNVATRREEARLDGHGPGLVATAFSPEGRSLAKGGQQVGVPLLRLTDQTELRRFAAPPSIVALAFSPDGQALATGGGTGEIGLWDAVRGGRLDGSADMLLRPGHLTFGPGADELWSIADAVYAHDACRGRQLRRVEVPHDGVIDRLALSADRTLVAGVDDGQHLVVWGRSGRAVATLGKAARIFTASAFSPDGRRLYSGEWAGPVRAWNLRTQKELPVIDREQHTTRALRVSADGRYLACADNPEAAEGARPEIVVWDLEKGAIVHRLRPSPATMQAWDIAFSPGGSLLVAVGGATDRKEGFAAAWDIRSGQEKLNRSGLPGLALCVSVSPDGRMLAIGGEDCAVRILEVLTGGLRREFSGHESSVQSIAFAAGGRLVASASADAPIYVWDALGLEQSSRLAPWTAAQRDRAWHALAEVDAAQAFGVMREMIARPAAAVELIGARLRPEHSADGARVPDLVRALDADDFVVRESATEALIALGEQATAALEDALKASPSVEARQRIVRILGKRQGSGPQPRQALRALEVLERIGTPQAAEVLRTLARGGDGIPLAREAKQSLARLTARLSRPGPAR